MEIRSNTGPQYVDDNIINEKINFDTVTPDGAGFKTKHAVCTQNLFHGIVREAESQGMKVNGGKTQLMVVSDAKTYVPAAFFHRRNYTEAET